MIFGPIYVDGQPTIHKAMKRARSNLRVILSACVYQRRLEVTSYFQSKDRRSDRLLRDRSDVQRSLIGIKEIKENKEKKNNP